MRLFISYYCVHCVSNAVLVACHPTRECYCYVTLPSLLLSPHRTLSDPAEFVLHGTAVGTQVRLPIALSFGFFETSPYAFHEYSRKTHCFTICSPRTLLCVTQDACCAELLWGDELEYGVFATDAAARTIKLSLRGAELLQELQSRELSAVHRCEGCTWHPEYGSWMVEATPRTP